MSKSSAGSKADTAVKLVMIFFISLLSFSVGTYVGKQVSDSDYRRAALESDFDGGHGAAPGHGAEANGAKNDHGDEATKPITDEEVASLTEEFVKKEERTIASEKGDDAGGDHAAAAHGDDTGGRKAPAAHGAPAAKTEDGYTHHSKIKADEHEEAIAENDKHAAPAHAEAPAHGAPAKAEPKPAAKAPTAAAVHGSPAGKGVEKAAERVAHDMAPAADPKKVREPSAVLPTVATTAIGKYTVQVASYATEKEAKDQASKLTGKGYSAFYIPASVNGKTWYRVSVGLFSDQKGATNYRTELLATQAVTSAIVQKIVK